MRVELGVVQFVVAEGGEELVRAVAGQFVLIGVAAAAAREVLTDYQNTQGDGSNRACQADAAFRPAQQRGRGDAAHPWLQQRGGDHGDDGQRCQQRIDRVGLEDVVDHLVGVDQIVDRDEVEAHPELVPEQPFGHCGEQHQEDAKGHGYLQQAQVPALAPEPGRTQQQVQCQWREGVEQEGQVIDCAFAVQAQHTAGAELRFAQVGQQQDRTGNNENTEPEGCEQAKKTGLGGFEQGHVTVHG